MGPRAGFRVILHAECLAVFQTNTLYCVVVQIDMRRLNEAWRVIYYLFLHAKSVILARYLAFPAFKVFYRVVDASVPVVEFVCW